MYERKAPRLEPVLSEMRKNDLSGIISVYNLSGTLIYRTQLFTELNYLQNDIIIVCNLSDIIIYKLKRYN